MRKFSKVLCMMLTVALFITALSGCTKKKSETASTEVTSNFNPEGYPIVKEKITLKMMGVLNPANTKWEENLFFKRMEEKTNIGFEFVAVASDVYNEKKSLAFASGDLPDVFFKANLTAKEEVNLGKAGILIELEDLIDKYSVNLKKILEENPSIKRNITAPGNHIYALPYINEGKSSAHYYLNKKWMDEYGLEEPETPEDLYNILKTFKEKNPKCIPFSVLGFGQLVPLLSSYGLLFNEDNIFVDDDGKVVFSPADDRYKKGMKFLNKLYKEQLLDNETFTQTKQQLTAKGTEGRVGLLYQASPYLVVGNDKHFDYQSMIPLTEKPGGNKIWRGSSETIRGTFAITNKNKYPAETIRWIDYLYSEEGGIMASAGIENEDYKYNADGTWDWILEPGETSAERTGKVSVQGVVHMPFLAVENFTNKINDPIQKSIPEQRKRVSKYDREVFPQTYFSDEDQAEIASLTADMNKYVVQSAAQFITGDLDVDKEWDSYIMKLEKMGMKRLVDIYQKRYDAWLKGE